MKVREAKKAFTERLKRGNHKLRTLTPVESMAAMMLFYLEEQASNCAPGGRSDMLLFQWGTYDWGEGEHFELNITRQLIQGRGEDDEDIWQLSLTHRYKPDGALAGIGHGNRWCEDRGDLAGFRRFVQEHPAYEAARARSAVDVILYLEQAG